MMKLSMLLAVCTSLMAPVVSPAQEPNPDDFKSVKAKRAIREYLDRGEKATKEFQKEKEDATQDLIEELENVLKRETADGNLDEAIKLRNTVKELKQDSDTDVEPAVSEFLGRWKIRFTTREDDIYYDFIQKGNQLRVIRWQEPDQKVQFDFPATFKDGHVVGAYNNGDRVERFHIDGDRLMIEHWYIPVAKTTNSFPQHSGIGEKVKK